MNENEKARAVHDSGPLRTAPSEGRCTLMDYQMAMQTHRRAQGDADSWTIDYQWSSANSTDQRAMQCRLIVDSL
jgi:hypothetical protein